jgi:hypothetical protein
MPSRPRSLTSSRFTVRASAAARPRSKAVPDGASAFVAVMHLDDLDVPVRAEPGGGFADEVGEED